MSLHKSYKLSCCDTGGNALIVNCICIKLSYLKLLFILLDKVKKWINIWIPIKLVRDYGLKQS